MKAKYILPAIFFVSFQPVFANEDVNTNEIKEILNSYQIALNNSDTSSIVNLYTEDGVQMAPDLPAVVGKTSVMSAYDDIFKSVSLDLNFTVDEIKVFSSKHAIMRSHSYGTLKVKDSNNIENEVSFKELWVLDKTDSGWKFSHYSFSSAPVNK